MSNSIAVPLVLLNFKVLLLPLIIANEVLEQLVLQLIELIEVSIAIDCLNIDIVPKAIETIAIDIDIEIAHKQ